MHATIPIVVVAAAFVQTASAYSKFMELIPNGENIGKTLGHLESDHTDFGTLFVSSGTDWAAVCSQTWPGGSVTCGEALGDPCCVWTSKDPDFPLTEPNLEGTTCASPGGSSAATVANVSEAHGTASESPTQTAVDVTDKTAKTDTFVTDSDEYCE